MITSFIEWGIGNLPLPEKIKVVKEAGVEAVSLHPFFSDREEEEGAVKAVIETGLNVTFHTANEASEVITEKIGGYIKTVKAFHENTGKVLCFSIDQYHSVEGGQKKLNTGVMKRVILDLVGEIAPLGIKAAVENGTCLTTREDFKALADHVGGNGFGMLLDLGHMNLKWLRGEMSVEDFIYSMPLEIFELHVHDNDGENDQHQLLGKGNLDLTAAVAALRRRKFDGVATFEMGCTQNAGSEWVESIKQSRQQFLDCWGCV